MLEHTLDYARRGWLVFPAHGIINGQCTCRDQDCLNPGEHHRIRDWPNRATTDEEQIREWRERWPNANVAIATGQVSGIVVLDVDPRIAEQECPQEVIEVFNVVHRTLWATTGGGREHFYFAIEGKIRGCNNFLLPGLDLKAEGGYVIAPPSRHISGEQYEWGKYTDPIPLPASFYQRLQEPQPSRETPKVRDFNGLDRFLQGVPKGQRNDATARLAEYFIRLGMRDSEISSWLLLWNRQNLPPLAAQEIQRIVASVRRIQQQH